MTCPRTDALLAALHCGEPAAPDCPECASALADERAFVALVERGLAGVRPLSPIAPFVRAQLARRLVRRPSRLAPLTAAAAVAVAAVALALALRERPAVEPPVVHEAQPVLPPPAVERAPDLPRPPPPVPPPPEPSPLPAPEPPARPSPAPEPPAREPAPPAPTVPERRVEVAVVVRSGALSAGGRRLPAGDLSLAAGDEFRAEGRTRIELAGASLQLEGGSRASVQPGAFALHDGEALVEGAIELRLACVVRPLPSPGRFIAIARPDRIVIEEGGARAGGVLLAEGRQYRLGREPAAEKRTLASRAARPRETPVWSASFDGAKLPSPDLRASGAFAQDALRSTRVDSEYCWGSAGLASAELRLFTAKPTTHVRFRYFMKRSAPVLVQLWNMTRSENFQVEIAEPAAGAWTTITVRAFDLPANPGGRKVAVGAGDVFSTIGWNVGRPGEEAEILVDDFAVVEIGR